MKNKEQRHFLSCIAQSVTAQVGISVYILVDTYFISVYAGADGLAVLNLVIPFLCLIYAVGTLIGSGSATRWRIDSAMQKDCGEAFAQSVLWSALAGLPFLLSGLLWPGELLELMGAGTLTQLGTGYMRTILLSAPLFMVNYSLVAFLRNDKDSKTAMRAALLGSGFNLVFDYVFMFVLDLGLAGAALATAGSHLCTASVCLSHFRKKENTIAVRWSRPRFASLLAGCRLGMSAMMGELSTAVTTGVYNALILHLAGSTGLAAFGIVCNISCVVICVFGGIAEGAQPLLSEKYGIRQFGELRRLFRTALLITLSAQLMLVAVCVCLPEPIITIFNSGGDAALQSCATEGMRLYFPGYLFAGLNMLLLTWSAATDRALPAAVGAWLRGVVAIVGFAVGLAVLWGMKGVWLSFVFAEGLSLPVILLLLKKHPLDEN